MKKSTDAIEKADELMKFADYLWKQQQNEPIAFGQYKKRNKIKELINKYLKGK